MPMGKIVQKKGLSLYADYKPKTTIKGLGFKDKEYSELGVKFVNDDKKLIENADIIVQINLLDENKTSLLKSEKNLVGILNPHENKNRLDELVKKKVNLFSLELLPIIT